MTQVTAEQVQDIVIKAGLAAREAADAYIKQHGERDACGFAWCKVYGVKLSTTVGKAFADAGFIKAYGGGIQYWNPAKSYSQSISVLEAGADAFVKVLREKFPELQIYSQSRMD